MEKKHNCIVFADPDKKEITFKCGCGSIMFTINSNIGYRCTDCKKEYYTQSFFDNVKDVELSTDDHYTKSDPIFPEHEKLIELTTEELEKIPK